MIIYDVLVALYINLHKVIKWEKVKRSLQTRNLVSNIIILNITVRPVISEAVTELKHSKEHHLKIKCAFLFVVF